jgi:hypothetical protein
MSQLASGLVESIEECRHYRDQIMSDIWRWETGPSSLVPGHAGDPKTVLSPRTSSSLRMSCFDPRRWFPEARNCAVPSLQGSFPVLICILFFIIYDVKYNNRLSFLAAIDIAQGQANEVVLKCSQGNSKCPFVSTNHHLVSAHSLLTLLEKRRTKNN